MKFEYEVYAEGVSVSEPTQHVANAVAEAQSLVGRYGVVTIGVSEGPNYSGWRIDRREDFLDALADRGVEPAFEFAVAHHVTYEYPDVQVAPFVNALRAVGHVTGDGVQAVACEVMFVDGPQTWRSRRTDGGLYHVTVSVAHGHSAAESNEALASRPVLPFEPFTFAVERF